MNSMPRWLPLRRDGLFILLSAMLGGCGPGPGAYMTADGEPMGYYAGTAGNPMGGGGFYGGNPYYYYGMPYGAYGGGYMNGGYMGGGYMGGPW